MHRNTTITITRMTVSALDAHGQPTGTWATVEAGIPASIQPGGGREMSALDQRNDTIADATLYINGGHDLREIDRVTDAAGVVYNVGPVRNWGAHIEAPLECIR